jgi:hypothetical protein
MSRLRPQGTAGWIATLGIGTIVDAPATAFDGVVSAI